jgi:hypothetical protein
VGPLAEGARKIKSISTLGGTGDTWEEVKSSSAVTRTLEQQCSILQKVAVAFCEEDTAASIACLTNGEEGALDVAFLKYVVREACRREG